MLKVVAENLRCLAENREWGSGNAPFLAPLGLVRDTVWHQKGSGKGFVMMQNVPYGVAEKFF